MENFYLYHATMKEGAIEILEHLTSNGVKCCLATATSIPHVEIMLKRYDLKKYFSGILSCSTLGVGKDKPDIYYKAIEILGLEANECCVVEDSFVAIESAKLTGAKTIGVYDKFAFNHARLQTSSDYYINDNENLLKIKEIITF